MSGDEAVKALREWCALRSPPSNILDWLCNDASYAEYDAAEAFVAAAPALLARLEAGEGLLREAREGLFIAGLDFGYCGEDDPAKRKGQAMGRDIHARIDAFLAAKEVDRG